jgi:hypothetical protein
MSQNPQLPLTKSIWKFWVEPPANLTKPQKIFVGILITVLAVLTDSFTKGYILSFLVPYGDTVAITWGILRVAATIVITISAAFVLFKKLKHYCVSGLNGSRVFIISASVVLLAVFALYSYKSIVATNEFNNYMESTRAEGNKRTLQLINKELPLEKKVATKIDIPKLTYLYAQDIYRHEGRIIEYQTSDGRMSIYTPIPEDQKMREILLFMRVYTNSTKAILIINSCFASIAIIGALVVGFFRKKDFSNTV